MKFYAWSNGDPSVGIDGCSANIEIHELENWRIDDCDCVQLALDALEEAFSQIFGEKTYVIIDTEG